MGFLFQNFTYFQDVMGFLIYFLFLLFSMLDRLLFLPFFLVHLACVLFLLISSYVESVVLHAAYHNNVLSLWVAATRVMAKPRNRFKMMFLISKLRFCCVKCSAINETEQRSTAQYSRVVVGGNRQQWNKYLSSDMSRLDSCWENRNSREQK